MTLAPGRSDSPARFSAADRHLLEEETLRLTTVGVDIGSSTTHLVFSRLLLERQDTRYVVTERTVLAESDILLTPYRDSGAQIDADALGQFVERAYARAGLRRSEVDTGALILTGAALDRENARAIGDLFAADAGRFVAVSAGDNLEALLAAHGSGAVALSAHDPARRLLHVDIGGGTTKLAACRGGTVGDVAALDVGARLVALDADRRIVRLEPAGRAIGEAVGLDLALGQVLPETDARALAAYMAARLVAVIRGSPGAAEQALLRTAPLTGGAAEAVTVSGGVSEFFYGRDAGPGYGDLGPLLAAELRTGLEQAGMAVLEPAAGIRATVIGASQYTVQLSGSTIFVAPEQVLPLRNLPAVRPNLELDDDVLDAEPIAGRVSDALRIADLAGGSQPVALAVRWAGLATYRRIDAFCRGVVGGLAPLMAGGQPLVLVFEGDVGGLFGIHLREEIGLPNAVVSIDGIQLAAFDFLDIGEIVASSGAVPVVIKSLVFPHRRATGTEAPAPAHRR